MRLVISGEKTRPLIRCYVAFPEDCGEQRATSGELRLHQSGRRGRGAIVSKGNLYSVCAAVTAGTLW